jgi:hypothetical protein
MSQEAASARFPLDGALVPGLLLLVARELVLYDPPRELAWQLFHELKDAPKPAWLALFLPRPYPTLFDDPVGLALAAMATGLAAAYALAALTGARPRVRAAILGLAALVLVALPTAAVISLGLATGRPYGHDGGVVQLPLALNRILAGQSPYGADYSDSILGWQSRSSVFWAPLGGNPIIHHHWYLPGMDLVMLPAYILARGLFGFFDARLVTFAGFLAAALLAPRLVEGAEARLAAAALVAVSPFVFWHQIFGTNDVLSAVPLLVAALLASRGRRDAAAVMVGVAASIKQLTWPFVPFFIVNLSGLESLRAVATRRGLVRLARPAAIVGAVLFAIAAPVAFLDPHAFLADIFRYQVGSPGSEQYPLGGTPGFGIANLLIYAGRVHSLGEYFPFQRFYLLFIPVGLLLLLYQLRLRTLGSVFVAGSAALLTSVYLSRIVNPNYVVLAALLLPLGMLMDRRLSADVALVPLLTVLLASEVSLRGVLHETWADAQASGAGLGIPGWLQPDPAGPRWRDPLSTGLAGLLAGLGIAYLLAALAGLGRRGRLAILATTAAVAIVIPTWVVAHVGIGAGLRRAQDRWYVEVLRSREAPGPGAWADRPGYRPTPVMESWTTSWRRDPPRPISELPPSPLAFALGRSMRGLGLLDPRFFTVLASLAAAICAWALARQDDALALIAVLLLAPAGAIGIVFGSGAAVVVALLLAAWVAARVSTYGGGALLGAATAGRPEALLLAPLVAIRRAPLRVSAGIAAGLSIVCLPLAAPFPGEFLRWVFETPALAPGLGLSNALYYRPMEPGPILAVWRIAAPLALAGLAALLVRSGHGRARPLAAAGALWAAALFLLPSMPAHAAAVPIVLLTAGALTPRTVSAAKPRMPSR